MAIRYIRQENISGVLWDRCIRNSLNGNVTVYSWYLDISAEHWDALVEDDYRSVMPLVYTEGIFFKRLYTPLLSKQLGIFSDKPVHASKINKYIYKIPLRFQRDYLCLNRQNAQALKDDTKLSKSVFELDMILSYEKKRKNYSFAVRKKILLAEAVRMTITNHISSSELERFLHRYMDAGLVNSIMNPLRQIILVMGARRNAEIVGAYTQENELCAVACFLKSFRDVILLFAYTPEGDEYKPANALLLDFFMKNFSGRDITLSFEHIDNMWNRELYMGFGAQESYYCHIKNTRFQKYHNLLKGL